MALINIKDLTKVKRISRVVADVVFSTDKAGVHKGEQKYQIRLRFSDKFIEAARLKEGDSVSFIFDNETGFCQIAISDDGVCSLHKVGSKLGVALLWREGMPSINQAAPCVKAKAGHDGITFFFPEETSFNGLARKDAA